MGFGIAITISETIGEVETGGGGGITTGFLLENGTDLILLEDGTSFLLQE